MVSGVLFTRDINVTMREILSVGQTHISTQGRTEDKEGAKTFEIFSTLLCNI